MQTRTIVTTSSEETEKLGERIGKNLRGGETIELISDLGGGKTTFTRGLARGFGSPDRVASPSFTISREYAAGTKRIHHFDFYRLQEAGIMHEEIAELVNDPDVVLVVEWADVVEDVLPADKITVTLLATSETQRTITVAATDANAAVVENA